MAIWGRSLESVEMKSIDKEFWKNKKVLITGFEGFLGSNLVKALLERKAKVIGLDLKTFRKETILCPLDYKFLFHNQRQDHLKILLLFFPVPLEQLRFLS